MFDNLLTHRALLPQSGINALLNCIRAKTSVNCYGIRLSHPMRAAVSLLLNGGIPPAVEMKGIRGRLEVKTLLACGQGKQQYLMLAMR